MFRTFRQNAAINKAIGAAEGMLHEFLLSESRAKFRTLPKSIYEDPYIWGYLANVIMHWLDLVYSDHRFSREDKARVARGALVAFSGMGMKRYTAISHTLTGEQTLEGMRQAHKMMAVGSGHLGAADDPEIADAFKAATKLLPGEPAAGVAAGLLKRNHLGRRIDTILNARQTPQPC